MTKFKWKISNLLKQLKIRKNEKKYRKYFNNFLNFVYVNFIEILNFEKLINSQRKSKFINKQIWK